MSITIVAEQVDENGAKVHCRVAQAVLGTLCGYVEWVNMSHVMHVSRRNCCVAILLKKKQHSLPLKFQSNIYHAPPSIPIPGWEGMSEVDGLEGGGPQRTNTHPPSPVNRRTDTLETLHYLVLRTWSVKIRHEFS